MQEIKKRITPESLCFKMPLEVIDLTYYIKSIEFYEKPDYHFIRKMLYQCLERQNIEFDVVYDWNLLEDVDFKMYAGDPKIVAFKNPTSMNGEDMEFKSDPHLDNHE